MCARFATRSKSALPLLRRLTPPVISTLHVGPSNGAPECYRITLEVFAEHDLRVDEKQRVIEQARSIIEHCLQKRGYPPNAIPTFEYGVMYANADRNMNAVGAALKSALAKLGTLSPPIASAFQLGPFSGEPNGFEIYLSVASNEEVVTAQRGGLADHVRPILEKELLARGYSFDAIKTFSYTVVSQKDVDKAGGWYMFLR